MAELSVSTTLMRQPFKTVTVLLRNEQTRNRAQALLANVPVDNDVPLEIVLREPVKARGTSQNALMWAGALKDLAEQAWINGRQYSEEVWHEHLKREYLPDDDMTHEEITRPGYQKWEYLPNGDRVLTGSTTQLTKRGFANYLEQVHAFGAGLGVLFGAAPGRDR